MMVTVGSRGQITLPKSLRQRMRIKPGDSITLTEIDDYIMLRPITDTIFDLRGVVLISRPQDLADVREKARQLVAEDVVKGMENG